jgi:type II secretory pathway predicted ATPase ExeA
VYEAHFGLTGRPFREALDAGAFVELPSRVAALRRLAYGFEHAGGAALLFGAPGSGKTMVARRLAAAGAYRAVVVDYPAMGPESLVAFVAGELGALPCLDASDVPDLAVSVRAVRGALADASGRGERVLLVVDDAHLVADRRALDALRLLLNVDVGGGPALALLLVGEPDLALGLPAALADRLAARCLLRPLDRGESDAYVRGRLERVGAAACPFDDAALEALHAAAEGLPRRLNRVADLALLVAAAEGRRVVGPELVQRLALDELTDALAA